MNITLISPPMKKQLLFILFLTTASIEADAQDTLKLSTVSSYINKTVTFKGQALEFDSRKNCIYLYYGNRYPHQLFTVIVQRTNGEKTVKLKKDIMLGRKMVYFTGTVINYDAKPDTTANYDTDAIKREIETDKPMTVGGN